MQDSPMKISLKDVKDEPNEIFRFEVQDTPLDLSVRSFRNEITENFRLEMDDEPMNLSAQSLKEVAKENFILKDIGKEETSREQKEKWLQSLSLKKEANEEETTDVDDASQTFEIIDDADEKIVVDDIHTLIERIVKDDELEEPSFSKAQLAKQLRGFDSENDYLTEIFSRNVQKIEALEQSLPSRQVDVKKKNGGQISSMPQYIRVMYNLTDEDVVTIGPNGTKIQKDALTQMPWHLTKANITRKILLEVFDRHTLATHTLSGKPSPAFVGCNKPAKMQLNPEKVEDIIYLLTNSLEITEKNVRQTITTKCADENKMHRQREERRQGIVQKRTKASSKKRCLN